MPDLVPLNLTVGDDLSEMVSELARDHHWTKREVVTTAVEALADLMERHQRTAANAKSEDVGELFLRLAHLMPAGLTDVKVEEARFSDGRPALIVKEEWVFAEDRNGDLMVARRDGSQVGHVAHGKIEVLADRDLDLEALGSLN